MNTNQSSNIFQEPETSENPLVNIIKWVADGDIVVIHNKYGQFRIFSTADNDMDLNNHRIEVVLCDIVSGLLDDGEWNWYIVNSSDSKNIEHSSHEIIQKINNMIAEKASNVFVFNV